MIKKIDSLLNFSSFFAASVYYNRRYELGCGHPFKGRTPDVWTFTARISQTRRRHQWLDFPDRTEPREPFGKLAQKSSGRHSDGARRFFHPRLAEQSTGVFPTRRTHRHWYRKRRAAPGGRTAGEARHVDPARTVRPQRGYRRGNADACGRGGWGHREGKNRTHRRRRIPGPR